LSRGAEWARMSGVDRRGRKCAVRVRPAPAGSGIVFNGVLRAGIGLARSPRHATWLVKGRARVGMVEHLLAACFGLGVEDLEVETTGAELPLGDGSALPYVRLLRRAGAVRQRSRAMTLRRPVGVRRGSRFVVALPGQGLSMTCLSGPAGGPLQLCRVRVRPQTFEMELAPARTFVRADRSAGQVRRRLRLRFALRCEAGWVVPRRRRFPDEQCRHKVLDLLGDLALLGRRLNARIVAGCPGHGLNLALVRRLKSSLEAK